MSKQEMIQAIRQMNRTVPVEYLGAFEEHDLDDYLQRLTRLWKHRGRQSSWVRSGSTHAVVTCQD